MRLNFKRYCSDKMLIFQCQKLQAINAKNPRDFTLKCLRKIFTNNFEKNFTWAGVKIDKAYRPGFEKRRTKDAILGKLETRKYLQLKL